MTAPTRKGERSVPLEGEFTARTRTGLYRPWKCVDSTHPEPGSTHVQIAYLQQRGKQIPLKLEQKGGLTAMRMHSACSCSAASIRRWPASSHTCKTHNKSPACAYCAGLSHKNEGHGGMELAQPLLFRLTVRIGLCHHELFSLCNVYFLR